MKTSDAMLLNFITSVGIIWSNKIVFNSGFVYPITLTMVHFVFTFVGLLICVGFKFFRPKHLHFRDIISICVVFCAFVLLNNASLNLNSVSTYQLLKVLTTPTIVFIQYVFYPNYCPSLPKLLALVPICLGVVLATVSSIDLNVKGIFLGTCGIFATSIYQIWVKTEQKRLRVSSEQLLFYQAPISAFLLLPCALYLEGIHPMSSLNWNNLIWIGLSALLAFLVNLSIFLVIGKTSPVAYNVLGHGKLCVVLLSGYVLFGEVCTVENCVGVILAISGIVAYTHLSL